MARLLMFFFFFFNDTATTEIYTLSLHDALPISRSQKSSRQNRCRPSTSRKRPKPRWRTLPRPSSRWRSEEHTSELQSQSNLVCRLLLEKKKRAYQLGVTAHRDKGKIADTINTID